MHPLGDVIFTGSTRRDMLVRDGLLIVAGSLLVAVCARIQVPGPVPTTLQTFAVVLVGATLGSKRGALALTAYLLEGVAGVPVFARAEAGPFYFLGPTTGYLVGFVVAAFVAGRLSELGWDRRFGKAVLAFSAAHSIILVLGFCWLTLFMAPRAAFVVGIWAFVPGAVLKSLLAATALPAGWKLLRRFEPDGASW